MLMMVYSFITSSKQILQGFVLLQNLLSLLAVEQDLAVEQEKSI